MKLFNVFDEEVGTQRQRPKERKRLGHCIFAYHRQRHWCHMSSSRDFLSQCFASRSTDCDSDREPTQADLQKKLKRKEQTQKARDASLVSRALKKAQKNGPNDEQTLTPAQTLQRKFLTGRLHHAYAMSRPYDVSAPDNQKSIQRERARCVWSLLCFLAKTLEDLFSMGTPVKHIINTIVPDDTTTRLRGPNPGDRTMVYTLMNQVQSCIVNYEKKLDSSNTGWHCLALPCPTSILHVADTPNIHAAYTSYLLASASGIGKGLQRLGLSQDLEGFHGAKWIAQVMCGDALEANSAAFNVERRLLTQRRERGERLNVVAIRYKCGNHQLCLARKCIVLGVERFWCTLVRLAHLFECSSFRRRFTAQLITLLKKPGVFERHSTLLR